MASQRYPEPTVGALIFNPKGKIFLMKSHKWRNKYVIPGGHIELGETIEEALKREIKKKPSSSPLNHIPSGQLKFIFKTEIMSVDKLSQLRFFGKKLDLTFFSYC